MVGEGGKRDTWFVRARKPPPQELSQQHACGHRGDGEHIAKSWQSYPKDDPTHRPTTANTTTLVYMTSNDTKYLHRFRICGQALPYKRKKILIR